ncbi:MAG: hypothetical protein ACFCUS_11875, partial [Rubrimonas sp.]
MRLLARKRDRCAGAERRGHKEPDFRRIAGHKASMTEPIAGASPDPHDIRVADATKRNWVDRFAP